MTHPSPSPGLTDRDGYGFAVGCLVRRYDSPRKHAGWVVEIDQDREVVKVEHATRGGFRYWRVADTHVDKPTEPDRARREGVRKTQAGMVGGDPHRPRKLG